MAIPKRRTDVTLDSRDLVFEPLEGPVDGASEPTLHKSAYQSTSFTSHVASFATTVAPAVRRLRPREGGAADLPVLLHIAHRAA